MVVKVFRDRRNDCGWYYLGGVKAVHVNSSTWVIACNDQDRKAPVEAYVICGFCESQDGTDRKPDRSYRIEGGYHLMFDWDIVEQFGNPDEMRQVTVIEAELADRKVECFIVLGECDSWLLSEEGKTIERLG